MLVDRAHENGSAPFHREAAMHVINLLKSVAIGQLIAVIRRNFR
jgi:hypothetical protein